MPTLRAQLEDFCVEEIPLYEPLGEGDHTFVWVEKRDRNTEDVARELARAARVPPRDVGYAGRKDRRAIARQWFSVPGLAPERALALSIAGVAVLRAVPHPHKLRTGQLRGNRFAVVVRDLPESELPELERRAEELARRGLPNRFGPQRFGREDRNLAVARALFQGERRPADRREARFLASVLQAAVFNEVLRTRPEPLDAVVTGDVAVVHASGGLFRVEDALRESERAARFEISATGPIFGTRTLEPAGAPAARERAVLDGFGIPRDLGAARPRGVRLRGGRRALRVQPGEVDFRWSESVLKLRFSLPPGSYATVLLDELLRPGG